MTMTPKDEKKNFKFVKVERGSIESIVSSTGVLNPVVTVQVGSQVSGTLSRVLTDFNKKVNKGDLVALIDTTFLAASVRDAQSSLDKASAQYEQSRTDLARAKILIEKNLGAKTDLETAQYNTIVARANFNSAQASLDRAKINLKYASITAPISGTVIARNVDVGQTVAASFSSPTLFLIANDLSKMQILANVDESDIGQIKEGQKVTFTVQTYPDKSFQGLVQQIRLQPTIVQNVVNYSVVVNVDNPDGLLLPGMTATIQFQISHADNVLKLANAALRFRATPEIIAEVRLNMENKFKNIKDTSGKSITDSFKRGGGQMMSGGVMRQPKRNSSTLYYIDTDGKLYTQRVRTGLTDGQFTEIISGRVQEGMDIISGVIESTDTKVSTSPLQGQQQSGGGSHISGGRGL